MLDTMIAPAAPRTPRPRRRSADGRRLIARLLLAAVATFAVLVPAAPAAAQRVRDVFPNPLSGADLDEIGRRLQMSPFQRLAVDPAHETYLDGYRELRERELEPFLTDLVTRGRTFFFNPDPQLVREFLRRLERAERRIATLDEALFAAFDGALTSEQRSTMPMVRQRRELDRLNSGVIRGLGTGIPATTMDYGRIIDRLDLTPAQREQMAPLVFDYENRVAAARRRLREQGERVGIELVEEASRLMKQVLAGGDLGPEAANIWIALRQTAFEKAKPVIGDAVDLARMNRDLINQWGPLLGPEIALQLRIIHYQYGYQEVIDPAIRVRDMHDRALRLPSLDPNLAARIEAMRDEFMNRTFRTVERFESEAFDAIRSATFILADEEPAEFRELEERYEEFEESCRAATEALEATLGADRVELLSRSEDEGGPAASGPDPIEALLEARPTRLLARQPDVDMLRVPEAGFGAEGPFIASAITPRELAWYAELLDLDDGQRELLEVVHLEYTDRYAAFRDSQVRRVSTLFDAVSENDEDDRAENWPSRPDAAAEIPTALFTADETLTEIENAFFSDIELIVLDANDPNEAAMMPNVRSARERVRLAAIGGTKLRGWAGRMARQVDRSAGREHTIDLDLLLSELTTNSAVTESVASGSSLEDYARARADGLSAHRAAWQEYSAALRAMIVASEDSGDRQNPWQLMNEARGTVTAARRDLVRLNRETLDRLDQSMPDGGGAALRDRYQRSAYPSVYNDDQSAEGPLLAALQLPDLGPDQRDRIRDVIAIYRPRHADLCNSLVNAQMEQSMASGGMAEWQQMSARGNRIEQYVFDREELNARALRALRSLLDERQAMEIGFAASAS